MSASYAKIKTTLNTFYVNFLPLSAFSCTVLILEMYIISLSRAFWTTSIVKIIILGSCTYRSERAEIVKDFSVNKSRF
jgi:hypothetical protein